MIRGVPREALINRVLPKSLFDSQADLSPADRKRFTDDIERIRWNYSLKPATTAIRAYRDELRQYDEVQVLTIELRSTQYVTRICQIVMHAIPYPMLIILQHQWKERLAVSQVRLSQADQSANVLEELWITESEPNLSDELDITGFRLSHLWDFYCDLLDTVTSIYAQQLGIRTAGLTPEVIRTNIRCYTQLNKDIELLRRQLQTEDQMNRVMELQLALRKIQKDLRELKG